MNEPSGEGVLILNPASRELIFAAMGPDPLIPKNMTQEDLESSLEKIFPEFVKTIISQMEQGTLTELQSPIYDRYTIDGHRAGAVIYTSTYGETKLKSIVVGTIFGNLAFALAYGAPEETFEKTVPIAENIIRSINLRE
jgi:hypothetical protein